MSIRRIRGARYRSAPIGPSIERTAGIAPNQDAGADIDLGKIIRLHEAAKAAASAKDARDVRYTYIDLRNEAQLAFSGERREEFDRLFHSDEPALTTIDRLWALVGWLEGSIKEAMLEQQVEANARAYADEKVRAERGVGFGRAADEA